ncbi:hypothetical protein [Tellurirhabdus rosea]|uniref:hypothetical protein n=1 Tax=Tellurirhabdus rosea TaxID=2674997 RepID=UPI002253D35D|nr:hypothetical protein [Tellurirhabdus rosea]
MLWILIGLNGIMAVLTVRLLVIDREVLAEQARRRMIAAVFLFNMVLLTIAVLHLWSR